MRARFIVLAAGIGSVALVLAAMCVAWAQNPPRTVVPGSRSVPESPSFDRPAFADLTGPAPLYSETTSASAPTRPAIVELRSGLTLNGHLRSVPIPCQAVFGDVSLPLETIRGIRMSDVVTADEGGQQRAAGATIVLANGDSLTGVPQVQVIHLQTEWGEAIVNLSHLKSLLLTEEKVIWQEQEGRWRLAPVPAAVEESALRADAADSLDASAESNAAPAAPPAPVPPPGTRGVVPALPGTSDDGR